jgi:siroheme decarboxylase
MLDSLDTRLLALIQQGLPVTARPYLSLAEQLDCSEAEVLQRLARLQATGLIKRFGVIVKHRRLGYQANAMVVWNIPDPEVQKLGQAMSQSACVNLCYQRPRHGERWPYNLYCMIHGKSREVVLQQLAQLITDCHLQAYPYEVLFSRQCFKQRGALYPLNTRVSSQLIPA